MSAAPSSIRRGARFAAAALSLVAIAPAQAHSFGQRYTLPVPLWLYAWGAAAALALSFVAAAYFLGAPSPDAVPRARDVSDRPLARVLTHRATLAVLRALGVFALLLCLATGWFGTPNPYANFDMTLFWVVFLLGGGWLTALIGDGYALLNPLRTLAVAMGHVWPAYARGRWRYPAVLGVWPAFVLYLAFITLELFGRGDPQRLAMWLAIYAALMLLGSGLFGARDWLANADLFAVWFRLVGSMAPVEWREASPPQDGRRIEVRLRAPFAGLLEMPAVSNALLLFILFMLASTAYDGLHETVPWQRLFWRDVFELLKPWFGDNPYTAYPALRPWFVVWQHAALWLAPFAYLGVYLTFVVLMRLAAGGAHDIGYLARRFAPSLLPIALVYHVAHYWTLLAGQGIRIVALVSDPFGRGWNLFGTAHWFQRTILPDTTSVWHTQVGLIVAGHVVSVVVAHLIALRTFGTPRAATLSQLPMLLLMVAFTVAGLWILAQPIQSGV